MGVNPPPRGRKKDQTISKIDKIFERLDKTFTDTFTRSDQMFNRVEQKMRDSEERLRGRMEETSERIRQRSEKVRRKLGNYDFTVDSDTVAKQLMRTMVIKVTIVGMSLAAIILFAISIIIINNSKPTNNQLLTPTPIEETVTTNTPKKL